MADVTVQDGDFIVTSTGETEESVRGALADPTPEPEATEAAPAGTDAPSTAPEAEKPADPKPKRGADARKQSIQAEIDELTAKRHEARRAMEAETAELQRLREELTKQQRQAVPTAGDGTDPEPTLDAFETYDAFVRAQAQWAARQVIKETRQQDLQRQAADLALREQDQRVRHWQQQWREAQASDPTFETSIRPELLDLKPWSALTPDERKSATVYNAIAEEVLRADNGPRLLQYLSEHFDTEFQRLASLQSPDDLRWSMAKLQGRLDAASSIGPASTPRPISSAKPPIKPMGSAPSAGDDNELSDDLPIEEYIRRANHRDRVQRAGR